MVGIAMPRVVRSRKSLDATEVDEVKELDRIEKSIQIFDVSQQRFFSLPELVQPGTLLHDADAVCIGELHDSETDHAMQRLILNALTRQLFLEKQARLAGALKKKIAVGVEYFYRQQQEVLDSFVFETNQDKQLTSAEFRKSCNWEEVWNYDWNLYWPVFRLCQLNRARLVGLNLPFEVSQQVSRNGFQSLPDWLSKALPDLDLSQLKHRRRFEDNMKFAVEKSVTRMSLPLDDFKPNPKLDSYYEAQTLWDEYMAESARTYLQQVGGQLLILAGVNHVWRDAIPDRLERRSKAGKALRAVSVVPWRGPADALPKAADYVWCDAGVGGGEEAARSLSAQRMRLSGKPKKWPAGFI